MSLQAGLRLCSRRRSKKCGCSIWRFSARRTLPGDGSVPFSPTSRRDFTRWGRPQTDLDLPCWRSVFMSDTTDHLSVCLSVRPSHFSKQLLQRFSKSKSTRHADNPAVLLACSQQVHNATLTLFALWVKDHQKFLRNSWSLLTSNFSNCSKSTAGAAGPRYCCQ